MNQYSLKIDTNGSTGQDVYINITNMDVGQSFLLTLYNEDGASGNGVDLFLQFDGTDIASMTSSATTMFLSKCKANLTTATAVEPAKISGKALHRLEFQKIQLSASKTAILWNEDVYGEVGAASYPNTLSV